MQTQPVPPWKGQQWEYQLIECEPGPGDRRIVGALDPEEHWHAIASEGFDGWEVVSVQAGQQRIPSAPGETKPVIVVLFKRPRPAKS